MQGAIPFSFSAPGISSNDVGNAVTPPTVFTASGSRLSKPPQKFDHDLAKNKKRKIDRACDACRRKKTKCDGPKMRNNVCTNCIQNTRNCTYVEGSRPRGPPKAYVTGLEDRLDKMETLLKRLRPESDFSDVLGPPVIRDSWKSADDQSPPTRSTSLQGISLSPPATSPLSQASPYASATPTLSAQTSYRPAQTLQDGQSSCSSSLSSPRPAPPTLGLSTHLMLKSPSCLKRTRQKFPSTKTRTVSLTALRNESSASSSSASSPSSSDTDEFVESFSRGVQRLTLPGAGSATAEDAGRTRFHGKSSSMTLIQATRAFKEQHMLSMNAGVSRDGDVQMHRQGLQEDETMGSAGKTKVAGHSVRRPEYWRTPRWELIWEGLHLDHPELLSSVLIHFPPPDLCAKLIELYFTHTNTQFPLLHKPTFDRQYSEPEPLYKKDVWFAAVCLGVFAVASRWCDDVRVLPEEEREKEGGEVDWTRAGWTYFDLVIDIHRVRRSLIHPACLGEIQTFTLVGMFLRGTASHPVGWFTVGIGIRKAQDVGAHRKKVYNNKPSVEEELWKRAWWCLVAFERIGSANLGRPCGVGEEDFDVDLPLAVNDEYWEAEDPAMAFRQPAGKPDLVTAFNLWVRLTQICAFATRTIYAVDKSQVLGRIATEWPEEVRAQLDTAMREWLDSVPEHLKWSNNIENYIFANQSATIYTTYYLTQLLIHRPFIRPPPPPHSDGYTHTDAETPCPALVVCTNAARSCARIVEKQLPRGLSNIPNLISVAHICAATLVVNVWNLKAEEQAKSAEDIKPPLAQTIEALMDDVYIFMKALEGVKSRWESAAVYLQKLRDSLPSSDDSSASTSVQLTSNYPRTHQPTNFDQTSVPGPSVLDQISMASSRLFPLEGPSPRHRGQSQDANDWRGQSDPSLLHSSYVSPPYTEHRNIHNRIPSSDVSLHENSDWQPLSQSSSPQPSHPDRTRIRPSSASYLPRILSTEMPPPSISAMRRSSFSGRNQDSDRNGQSHGGYYKHGTMSSPRSLMKPKDTDSKYSDNFDDQSVYYRSPPDVVVQSQLQPQAPWDKNNYRAADWEHHQHAAPMVGHDSGGSVTWPETTDRYLQNTSDIRRTQLQRDPQDVPYTGVYSI